MDTKSIELNRVYNEDCLIGMQRIPDKSVDMILCDLPYGTTACKWDVIIPFDKLWEQYERIIKDNGAIVLTASQPFTSALVMSNPKMFKYEWIYEKSKTSNYVHSKYQPLKAHENVVVFSKYPAAQNSAKKNMVYYPQMTIGKPYNRGIARNSKSIVLQGGRKGEVEVKSLNGERFPRSVKYFKSADTEGAQLHPTQKPVSLFEYLIKTYTNEGETVLDNCMGSFTTAIACLNTNRNYIGFEKDEAYFKVGTERIEKHLEEMSKPKQGSLFAA